MNQESSNTNKPGLIQIIGSVVAAAIGVQSEKNRLRDFQHGSAKIFIISGIIATVLFILSLFAIVKFVLSSAAS